MGFMFSIFIFVCATYLYFETREILWSASMIGGAKLLLSLIFSGISIWSVLAPAISFLLAFGYYSLLEQSEDSDWFWPAAIAGGIVVILV